MTPEPSERDVPMFPYLAMSAIVLQTVDMAVCSMSGMLTETVLSGFLLMLMCTSAALAADRKNNAYHYAVYCGSAVAFSMYGVVLTQHIFTMEALKPDFAVTRIAILALSYALYLLWFVIDTVYQLLKFKSPAVRNPQDPDCEDETKDPENPQNADCEDETKDSDVVAI